MCGIAGVIGANNDSRDENTLRAMTAALRHRGPDDDGFFVGRTAMLGMRRLSIIDLSTGDQPIHNEDESVWIVFNGEIYNFQELRTVLEKRGHRFYTSSDTEAIVHAYEEYGEDCPKYLRGMFAFAIYDHPRKRLFLARDRVGKKPLLYTQVKGRLIFASEFQGLLAHPDVRREVNREAIHYYLTFGYVPAPLTAYAGVFKLAPGHTLIWERGKAEIKPYWDLLYEPKLQLSEPEAIEQFLTFFTEAVRLRMISDVPLGAFLSGGVDSSSVVAVMSELSDRPVKTFSIGFGEKSYDELAHARRIAEHFATDHHEFVVEPKMLEVLPLLVRHYGEPYADSSAIPSYYLAKLTRQHVTVALNGDGGDELFGGYDRYRAAQIAGKLDRAGAWGTMLFSHASRFVPDSIDPKNPLRRARRFLDALSLAPSQRYLRWVSAIDLNLQSQLYTPQFAQETATWDSLKWVARFLDSDNQLGSLDALLSLDTHTYLPDDLLVKIDIATMANSLEARSPFLDHQLMEFVARLPESMKVRHNTSKYLLKKAMSGIVPAENLYRPKMGFGVPIGTWFRGEWKGYLRGVLLSDKATKRGYFRTETLGRLIDDHVEGRRDYAYQLWTLLMLELWHQTFID